MGRTKKSKISRNSQLMASRLSKELINANYTDSTDDSSFEIIQEPQEELMEYETYVDLADDDSTIDNIVDCILNENANKRSLSVLVYSLLQ
jgi:hypothetical protein